MQGLNSLFSLKDIVVFEQPCDRGRCCLDGRPLIPIDFLRLLLNGSRSQRLIQCRLRNRGRNRRCTPCVEEPRQKPKTMYLRSRRILLRELNPGENVSVVVMVRGFVMPTPQQVTQRLFWWFLRPVSFWVLQFVFRGARGPRPFWLEDLEWLDCGPLRGYPWTWFVVVQAVHWLVEFWERDFPARGVW